MSFQRFLPSFQRTQILGVQYSDVDCISKKGFCKNPFKLILGEVAEIFHYQLLRGPLLSLGKKVVKKEIEKINF